MLRFRRAVAFLACAAAGLVGSAALEGCHSSSGSLTVSVESLDSLPPVTRVDVTASAKGHAVVASVMGSSSSPISWPLTVKLNTAGLPNGDTLVEAAAFDAKQTMVADGTSSVTLPTSSTVRLELRCQIVSCARSDGGADERTDGPPAFDGNFGPDGPATVDPKCGNGRLDPGESCDTARPVELPGACPVSCDDGIPCTIDTLEGSGCAAACAHNQINAFVDGDGCCPAHGDHTLDSDCSQTCGNQVVDPGEACDIAIAGAGAGACPGAPSCDDGDPCTEDRLISEGTCSARCVHNLILEANAGDGCCPLAADATSDPDCHAMCGNGILEPGEKCDPGLTSGPGACPTAADCDDNDPCTADTLVGSGCQVTCVRRLITTPAPGDGCCPRDELGQEPGSNVDSDCAPECGNGVVESGETCDVGLPDGSPGSCPLSCPTAPAACVRYELQGLTTGCRAACVAAAVKDCAPISDGCCPTGCTSTTDPDCSAACGNGRVDPGETCDTAITTGTGTCPRTCSDGIACTDDLLVDAGTCNARCVFVPTTMARDGDGCCPPGAHAGIDADCPATCGNGVVESPAETCDSATQPPSCPATCPPPEACLTWARTVISPCDVRCTRQVQTACQSGDGCCPNGCSALNDSDCASVCGNGLLEPTEACDRGITAGHSGACPASCVDSDPCTLDFASGTAESCTRTCSHVHVTACGGGDRCCPPGCNATTDSDCAPMVCDNGQIEHGETCDPPTTCPTSCASDGDPCTVDQLAGSAASCTAACVHVPLLSCSGARRDGCCPTGCTSALDSDC